MPGSSNAYEFVSTWRVEATCGEVADILGDAPALARWWPSVYLDVQEIDPPDASGLGRRIRVLTKGWLPYTLRWEFVTTESRYPNGLTIEAAGDFNGRGVWTFKQDGAFVDITYDWRLDVEKPFVKQMSFLLKPVFAANHRWAMAQGEESLNLELARRRATSDAARAAVPPPPGPITYAGVALVAGAVAIGAGLAYLLFRTRRKSRGTLSSGNDA
jgi:hypothetical protein